RFDRMAEAAPDGTADGLPDDGLEPGDVLGARFDLALRGYRMSEVDAVLERLAGELARRDAEIARLRSSGGLPGRVRPAVGDGSTAAAPLDRRGDADRHGDGTTTESRGIESTDSIRIGDLFRPAPKRADEQRRANESPVPDPVGRARLGELFRADDDRPAGPPGADPVNPPTGESRVGDLFRPRNPAATGPVPVGPPPRPSDPDAPLPRRRIGLRGPLGKKNLPTRESADDS
ncbi:MAG: DivIVA domain-containing protein, partial [Frankia sp.]